MKTRRRGEDVLSRIGAVQGEWHMVACERCRLLVGWTRQPLPKPFYCILCFDNVAHLPENADDAP